MLCFVKFKINFVKPQKQNKIQKKRKPFHTNIFGNPVFDKQVDVTGVSTASFTGSFLQILWLLQRSYLSIQPSLGHMLSDTLRRSSHTDLD
jgi:hypothetical protein